MRAIAVILLLAGCGSGGGKTAGNRRVFVTSMGHSGVFQGLAGADSFCSTAAVGASLGGTWKAWLSDSKTDAITRIADVGPWIRLDGTKAIEDKTTLASTPLAPINMDETGATIDTSRDSVWTGTDTGGLRHADTCGDWAVLTVRGEAGEASIAADWTKSASSFCDNVYRLYCFEQ